MWDSVCILGSVCKFSKWLFLCILSQCFHFSFYYLSSCPEKLIAGILGIICLVLMSTAGLSQGRLMPQNLVIEIGPFRCLPLAWKRKYLDKEFVVFNSTAALNWTLLEPVFLFILLTSSSRLASRGLLIFCTLEKQTPWSQAGVSNLSCTVNLSGEL